MGAHVLAIKDMAGLCQPRAAAALVRALKEEVGLPVHFHTHDTSGIAAASVLAAVEAGADAVDCAVDAMCGARPRSRTWDRSSRLCAMVPATRSSIRIISVRYQPTGNKCGRAMWPSRATFARAPSEVYVHGMPGGQYTNLREQARALGLDEHRWPEVANAYALVNDMFGDIVKVTPTSKVVGDMAIMMVTSGLTRDAVLDPDVEIAFPESVVQLFRGDLGQPLGGFPPGLQKKVLRVARSRSRAGRASCCRPPISRRNVPPPRRRSAARSPRSNWRRT